MPGSKIFSGLERDGTTNGASAVGQLIAGSMLEKIICGILSLLGGYLVENILRIFLNVVNFNDPPSLYIKLSNTYQNCDYPPTY